MKNIPAFAFLLLSFCAFAQTETTNELDRKYSSHTFFLYNNTLRMINQQGDKAFDELIKDIEKLKIVWVSKKEKNFGQDQYRKLVASYKAEDFEEIMTTRYQGKNLNAYIKEKNGDTKGVVITADDGENVLVMDIVGKVALNKITSLFSAVDSSSDIGQKIKGLMNKEN
ncbi:MAG TPA: DUF4252 domain-containing protein [Cyclobacteriaceae bacterium]|nr:DUF4252 domain-containing protein [Cyclobacteriaceae bacterium]HMV10796.1 DUF4252 domain-containing protein [Cyclobacteriaceae bacterium]HMV88755.1 DUF4252 domain-containing protein [Cyclobacteriaceae bacterium]HMX02351.1 DUF4252 domain-containing protein [Cyclobacteriaceae bacterium]HMX51722.1 DUF4252 domain-containing protein [Cyclobacteriaceae bacterium]